MEVSKVELFYNITKEICELIDLIKCPICLEIYKDPVIIKCKHTFCSHCLDNSLTGVNKKGACPICRSTINRRDKYPNTSASSLLLFIGNITDGLKENLSVDLISDLYIRSFLKKHKSIDNYKNIPSSSEQVKTTPKKAIKSLRDEDPFDVIENIASTSRQINISTKSKITPVEDNMDPFDKLLGKKSNKNLKTYQPKRKEIDKDDLLEFEDVEQRLKIIKWLTDSQNEFERFTQTQQDLDNEENVDVDVNLPSISQSAMQKRKTRRHSRRLLNNNERRFRSLDIHVNKNTPRIKRNSLGNDFNPLEIENEKIIQIMEEECLNRYDDQFIKNKDKSQSSGWKKIPNNIKKSMNKAENKQKKLKISIVKQKESQKIEMNPIVNLTDMETFFKKKMSEQANEKEKSTQNESQIKKNSIAEISNHENNVIVEKVDANNKNNTSNNSNEDIFLMPTQDLLTNERQQRNEEDDNLLSYIEHFENIKGIVARRKKYRKLLPAIQKLQPTMQQLKVFLKTGEYNSNIIQCGSQTELSCVENYTQTKQTECVENCSQTIQTNCVEKFSQTIQTIGVEKLVQTTIPVCLDNSMQTDIDPGFYISSNEAFKTQKFENKIVQTESIINTGQNINDCILSHSMDNLVFETQAILNKYKDNIDYEKIIPPRNDNDFTTQFSITSRNCKRKNSGEDFPIILNNDDFQTQFTETTSTVRKSQKIQSQTLCNDNFETQFSEIENLAATRKDVPTTVNFDDFQTQFTETGANSKKIQGAPKLKLNTSSFVNNKNNSQTKISQSVIANNEDFRTQFSEDNLDQNPEIIADINKSSIPNSSNQINNSNRIQITESEEQSLLNVCDELKLSKPNEQINMSSHSSTANSNIVISIDTPKSKINRRLSYSEKNNENKFKRIRINSDSDSDEDGKRKKKRLPNKFVRNDVSVCFDTQNEKLNEIPSLGGSDLSMDYVDQVWNKIDQGLLGVELVEPKKNIAKPSQQEANKSKSKTQELLLKCDQTIRDFNKKYAENNNSESIKLNENNNSDKLSESLFGDSNVETCILNPNKTASDALIEDFNKPDDDDAVLLNLINSPKKNNVLQNVALNLPIEETKISAVDNVNSEEEMFYSDDDVIQDTPEKRPHKRQRTGSNSVLEKVDDAELTITPPPEFQDDNDDAMDITIINAPNVVETNKLVTNASNVIETNKVVTIPPVDSDVIVSLSPIRQENPQNKFNTPKTATSSFIKKYTSTPKTGQKQTSIRNFMRKPLKPVQENVQLFQDWKTLNRKPCIACTRLDRDQMLMIRALTNKKLATYSSVFNETVTHMIVNANESNCMHEHTIKYVSAVASGIWVVNFSWIQDSYKQNRLVLEEPYEVFDERGIPGPKESRLNRIRNPLFKGFKIHAGPPFLASTQKELENVVTLLGGVVATNVEDLRRKDGYICLVITESKTTQEVYDYQALMGPNKVLTVDIEWLSRSVSQYKLQNLRKFALCSPEYINEIEADYPEDLMKPVYYTQTQSTTLN